MEKGKSCRGDKIIAWLCGGSKVRVRSTPLPPAPKKMFTPPLRLCTARRGNFSSFSKRSVRWPQTSQDERWSATDITFIYAECVVRFAHVCMDVASQRGRSEILTRTKDATHDAPSDTARQLPLTGRGVVFMTPRTLSSDVDYSVFEALH